jgi:hypothetical protein
LEQVEPDGLLVGQQGCASDVRAGIPDSFCVKIQSERQVNAQQIHRIAARIGGLQREKSVFRVFLAAKRTGFRFLGGCIKRAEQSGQQKKDTHKRGGKKTL